MGRKLFVLAILGACMVGCGCDAGSSGGSCRCSLDTDCPDGFHCERCACLQDCTGPQDCPPEAPNCDVETGRCVGPCETNADCPDPAFPNCGPDGVCFGPCEEPADCTHPDYPNCGGDGVCNPACTGPEDCTHPDYPNCDPGSGLCFGPCSDNNDCPPEFPICDPQTGECLPADCTNDTQCDPPTTVCENYVCVPGCAQHSDCDPTWRCDLITPGHLYHCEPRDCLDDTDCNPPVTVCDTDGLADPDGGGYCEPGCQTFYDCRQLGYDCDVPSGRCAPHDYGDIGQDCGMGCRSGFCLAGMGNVCTGFCCVQHDCPPGWGCRTYDDGTAGGHTVDVCVTLDATHGEGRYGESCQVDTDCRSGICRTTGQDRFCRETCCTAADCDQPFVTGQDCRLFTGGTACLDESLSGTAPVGAMGCATSGSPSDCMSDMCFTYFNPDTGCTGDADCPANRPTCFDYTSSGTTDCVHDMCVGHCCSADDCPDYGGDIFFCGKWVFGSGDFNVCLLHEGAATGLEGDGCGNNLDCRSRFCSPTDSVCRKRCCTDADCQDPGYPRCALELLSVHGVNRWLNVCLP